MANFLTKLFGSKADRDNKELKPFLEKTIAVYETIKGLSNDQLRSKTVEFRAKIAQAIQTEESRINEIKAYLDTHYDIEIEEKENLYKEMESLEKKAYQITQDVLDEILPEAYAVVKETAKRFKENDVVSLAEKIESWIKNKTDRTIIRQECYRPIDNHFNPDNQIRIFKKVIYNE